MRANASSRFFAALRRGAIFSTALCCCVGVAHCVAAPSFVYETTNEFLAPGDFNGDGILDVLVLDKGTGNARVGYSDTNGNLTWSAPLVTGVNNAEGCGVGRWLNTGHDTIAVTASALNRVNMVDLSGTNTASAPKIVTPNGLGPHTVIPLADPSGGAAPAYNDLLVASSDNSDSAELLDLMGINAGVGTEAGQYGAIGPFDHGNALQLTVTAATYATGVARGTNDTLEIWEFTNSPSAMVSYSNLPSGSDYAFGVFNGETLPRFLLYQPGASNVVAVSLAQSNGGYAFSNNAPQSFSQAIQGVYYLSNNVSGGSFMILFANGVESLRFPGGVPTLSAEYSAGAEAAGNVFTGIVPLAGGLFALLDAPPGGTSSVHAQVVHFDGTNFVQRSSSNLPTVTARNTRANVWLFETEPFVNRSAQFIASFDTPDWTDSVNGLPGALTVTTETDGGDSAGLGSATADSLGAPPTGSAYGLPNQYNQAISLFSYSSPQSAEPVTVTISPPPGIYDGAITISFTTLSASDKVFYRVGGGGSWRSYTTSFLLTNNNTIQYYGANTSATTRSQLQFATYSLGIPGQVPSVVNLTTGTTTTNPPIYTPPTNVILSPVGTIFYGRRSTANLGTIWAINYDGSDDTYITQGVRPRVSRDGKWMAFLRGGNPFSSQGDVWLRNLQTSQETLGFINFGTVVCYDWLPDDSGLIMDYGLDSSCGFYLLETNGGIKFFASTDCYEEAPVVNPVTGKVAFHDVNPGSVGDGIYVGGPGGSNAVQIVASVAGASWPEWSPDGLKLSFVDDNSSSSLDSGTNLWVVNPDGSSLNRICDFTGTTNHFSHGALWSPDSTSLVGAATLYGTNGLWIVPLNSDRTDCYGAATLLPTTPGDAIDFAGSIVVAGAPPTELNLGVIPGTNSVIFIWSTNFPTLKLEYTYSLTPPIVWTPLNVPVPPEGINFEYVESITNSILMKIFRLAP